MLCNLLLFLLLFLIVIVVCRSQWPRGLTRRSSAARLLRSWVRISPVAWMFVCCECFVCCQVEVSATDWSLVQRSPTDCGVSLCMIKKPRKRGGQSPLLGLWKIQPQWVVKPGKQTIVIIISSNWPSNTPIFIVLMYYMGNMFRITIKSSSGPYIQIQILGYCVIGSHTVTYFVWLYVTTLRDGKH
jgi:hypothetical protein